MSILHASLLSYLADLEIPLVELRSSESAESALVKLRAQNDALESLREALVFEEMRLRQNICIAA